MRRDRDGSPIEDDDPPTLIGRHLCHGGWLGEDADGRPIPCYECRPHLQQQRTANLNRLHGPNGQPR